MILVIVNNYVTPENPYANGFVHRRVLSYLKDDLETKVFVLNKKKKKGKYVFEGVEVYVGYIDDLIEFMETEDVSAVCIHFINRNVIKVLNKIDLNIPIFIYVHGVEALHWYQRIFPYTFSNIKSFLGFCKYAVNNILNMFEIRKFFSRTRKSITLIAVSEWMKKIAKKNWKTGNIEWEVIPNIIDEELFKFEEKDPHLRYNILLIRPFTSGKYANDIAISVIKKLKSKDKHNKIKVKIIGNGHLFDKITKDLKEIENVEINKGFIHQTEIAKIHKQYGIFLCPTRQDAQGVSMCEAMSSGLIPITSNNTAIPEFLPLHYGLACNTEEELVQKIMEIMEDEKLFIRLSKEMAEIIRKKCGYNSTIRIEIDLIKDRIKKLKQLK
jgi:glycosyltransferase involved in cell wall biosynthesis